MLDTRDHPLHHHNPRFLSFPADRWLCTSLRENGREDRENCGHRKGESAAPTRPVYPQRGSSSWPGHGRSYRSWQAEDRVQSTGQRRVQGSVWRREPSTVQGEGRSDARGAVAYRADPGRGDPRTDSLPAPAWIAGGWLAEAFRTDKTSLSGR